MTHSDALFIIAVSAHFTPYVVLAAVVIVARLIGRRFSRAEKCLLMVFGVLLVLEYLQLSIPERTVLPSKSMGIWRYFGVFSPILWIFTAKGLAWLWGIRRGWIWKTIRIVVCLAFFGWFAILSLSQIVSSQTTGTAYDTAVAVERIVPTLRSDYRGPSRQSEIKRSSYEYYTGRRPLISCPFGYAGWAVRGDSCGATEAPCPYPEDYLFIPLGGGYAGITNVDERVYRCVSTVQGGLGTTWGLYRRIKYP